MSWVGPMSTVRKRRLPSGTVCYQVDYRGRDGKRHHKQFGRFSEAKDYLSIVTEEIRIGVHVAPSATITVEEAGKLWLARADREELEASTVRQYRQHLNLHIGPRLGSRKLAELAPSDIEIFRDALVEDLSRSLARAVLTSLKGILKEARRLGRLSRDLASGVSIKKKSRGTHADVDTGPGKMPSKDEVRAILAKATEMFPLTRVEVTRKREQKVVAICWRPFLVIVVFTGLRCSELRGLTWSNVDFQSGVIRVRQRADFQNKMGAPKTAAGTRDVPMAPIVLNTLREWRLACPKTQVDLVFPTENGGIHSNSNIHKQCWGPVQRAVGLERDPLILKHIRHL